MGVVDAVKRFLALEPYNLSLPLAPAPSIESQLAAVTRETAGRPWRLPSIDEALGVPGIARAVTLISNTVGSLTMQAYRNGAVLAQTPAVIARPNPYEAPQQTYRDMAYCLATRGETILWIASRDNDGIPSALVVVPLEEVGVSDGTSRFLPRYDWGARSGTRYSPANPSGEFVHITYLKEPGQLRGVGPLQINRAAASVAVEAQEWAANYFADGGNGGTLIKHAAELDPNPDADGLNEAERLRLQWISKPHNIPRVIDQNIESVTPIDVNAQGAQMLEARDHQTGDAARMFGIPGALIEFAQSGTSLTYQNLAEVWTNFVRGCLAPNYLEPIEQALSDLLPRSTAVRFNVEGLLRADVLTRANVYNVLIPLGVMTLEQAMAQEGYAPGNVEYAAVPPAPPAAIPKTISRMAAEVRCSGAACHRMLGRLAPPYEIVCPRCKYLNVAA